MEVDNQFRFRQRHTVHRIGQHMHKRQNNQTPHQLEQQTAERHAARRSVGGAVVDHRQNPRTEVGANHQHSATGNEITPVEVRVAVNSTAAGWSS